MKQRTIFSFVGIVLIAFLGLFFQGCGNDSSLKLQTEYQTVTLANGQVFFGTVEFQGKDYVLLKNVFYIRSQVNQETKQVANTLVKKGQEWNGAEQMYINTRHIFTIEPVSPESQVAKLIKEQQSSKRDGQR